MLHSSALTAMLSGADTGMTKAKGVKKQIGYFNCLNTPNRSNQVGCPTSLEILYPPLAAVCKTLYGSIIWVVKCWRRQFDFIYSTSQRFQMELHNTISVLYIHHSRSNLLFCLLLFVPNKSSWGTPARG